jgi:hypothetical protein
MVEAWLMLDPAISPGFRPQLREAGARVLVTCRSGEEQLLSSLRKELDTEELEVLRCHGNKAIYCDFNGILMDFRGF